MNGESAASAPPTAGSTPRVESAQPISIAELAGQLHRKRKGRGLTLEQAGEQIGVSAATLSRLERRRQQANPEDDGKGSFVPDTRTLAAVTRWLDLPPGGMVEDNDSEATSAAPGHARGSVPDVVEAHLRGDRNLDGESARALAQMFRTAYDQFSRLRQGQAAGRAAERSNKDEHEATA